MKRIRAGRGLGDAIYLHPIVRHLSDLGMSLQVCTQFPQLYPFPVEFAPWSRQDINYTCHYTHAKNNLKTTQFQDMCQLAGIGAVEYSARWSIGNSALVESVRQQAGGKPLLLVNAGRQPMDRADGYGRELLPDEDSFNRVLAQMREQLFAVYIGSGERFWAPHVDLDLNNQTTVTDVMDLAMAAAAGFTQCGFIIPLMEVFSKPMMIMLTAEGRVSRELFIRQLVPEKLCGQPTSAAIYDDWQCDRIDERVAAFCRAAHGSGEVLRQTGSAGR